MKRLSVVALALFALEAQRAEAQANGTTIGFENGDCGQNGLGGNLLFAYGDTDNWRFNPCGLDQALTGEAGDRMRIASTGALLSSIPGVTGDNALVGSFSDSGTGSIALRFRAPYFNDVSFQLLDIDDLAGLTVSAFGAGDSPLPAPMLTQSGSTVYVTISSPTPVARVDVQYVQQSGGGLLNTVDRWYLDQLSFASWSCGDGVLQAGEACDDGNGVVCDGCTPQCQPSIVGCFNGSTCVDPSNPGTGCFLCDMTAAPDANGNIPPLPRPMGTACEDTLKCTSGDTCDGSGVCRGTPVVCDDGITCTSDVCSESAPGSGCTHTIGARDCLIEGACFAENTPNPANACQRCSPTTSSTSWSAQGTDVRCSAPTCVGSEFTPAGLCDGAGSCSLPAPVSCGNFACASATSCTDSCSNDRECGPASHCDLTSQKCIDNLPLGQACTDSSQCASGSSCSDGVCCDSACGSKCETCKAKGFEGKCVNITFGDPDDECPDGSSCRSGNQCVVDAPSVPEQPGNPLQPGVVAPIGAACTGNEQCGNGICRDGVCCDRACDGVCESCNVAGSPPGQCTPHALGSDPEGECGGGGSVCGGQSACTRFETRGNGLCAATPGVSDERGSWGLVVLAGLAAVLAARRRARRRG